MFDQSCEVDRAQKARSERWQRLLAAVVHVEAVRIERVYPGNLDVINVLNAISRDARDDGCEPLAIEGALVARQ